MKRYAAALLFLLPCLAAIPEVDKGKALGNPRAPVRIEIFSDFSCPHCRVLHEQTLPMLMKDYVVPGKVYIVDRAFPLLSFKFSREAFGYAVAAARIDKYQQVADVLYGKQDQWNLLGNVWGIVSPVLSATEQKKVQELAKDPKVIGEIEAEYQEGVAVGVVQTPTMVVFVGSRRYPLPPAPNYTLLKSMIDGLLPK